MTTKLDGLIVYPLAGTNLYDYLNYLELLNREIHLSKEVILKVNGKEHNFLVCGDGISIKAGFNNDQWLIENAEATDLPRRGSFAHLWSLVKFWWSHF